MQILAYISMFIDHICKFALKGQVIYPLLGRLAMPIFAYLIAVGMKRTRSKEKYILRMLIFAILSQIPFILMIYGPFNRMKMPYIKEAEYTLMYINHYTQYLNIGFTFLISLLTIYFIDKNKTNIINKFIILVLSLFLITELNTDYGVYGLITVFIFYYLKSKAFIVLSYIAITTYSVFKGSFTENFNLNDYFYIKLRSYFSVLSLPIIFYFNKIEKKFRFLNGKNREDRTGIKQNILRLMKYSIYPIHMLLIYLYRIYF